MSDQFSIKYRPTTLDDMVIGNPDILDKVEAIAKKAQSVLITGRTGCGKTTLAGIMNRILNQEDYKQCLLEKNCVEEGGIETIREILEFLQFKPRGAKHFILLDEVQGLTPKAMSALLKVIESPPHKKVCFVLCTDQPFKLLAPLVNRCRQLNIEEPEYKDLAKYLYRVVKSLKLRKPETELKDMCIKIAKAADCVPRMAMQLLEDCVDLINAGKSTTSIASVISKADEGNLDKIVGSTLIAIYSSLMKTDMANEAAMYILGNLPTDSMGFLTRLQSSNYYAIQMMNGGKWDWKGKIALEALKAKKIKPSVSDMLYVSSKMNDIRERLQNIVTDPTVSIGTGLASICYRGIK